MAIREYEVLVSAIMVRTGPGKGQVRRILRGGTLIGDHQDSRIRAFRAAKAIGQPKQGARSNAQTVTRAFHGIDDPVAAMLSDALPVPAAVSQDPLDLIENEDVFAQVNSDVVEKSKAKATAFE